MSDLKKMIFELTHCAGCQTCLRIDEKDAITQLEHFISSNDITDEVTRLRASLARITESLKKSGASLPAPELKGTIESSIITGLSIALALVESESVSVQRQDLNSNDKEAL
jgi:hypothetical protein